MDLPGPGAVFFFVREQPRGFRNQAREDIDADREIRAPDQSAVVCFDERFGFGQMFEPSRGADHDRNVKRRNFLDVAEHGRGHREFHRHVGAIQRFVAIDIHARGDSESVLGRELIDQAPHLAVADDGEIRHLVYSIQRPPDRDR